MENIKAEILKATDLSQKRNEDEQAFLCRVVRAVAELDDKAWEGLSSGAQDWYNEAADNMNAKKDIDPMPEPKGEAEEKPATRRRSAPADEPKDEPKSKSKEEKPADPVKGDMVKLTTKRGEEFEGEILELDEDEVVLKVDGEEEAFRQSKIESIVVIGGGKSKAKDEPKSKAKEEKAEEKPKTKRVPGAKPVTQRMREVICENDEWTKEQVSAQLKKEGLEFRDATLDIMFTDTMKTITTLKEMKRFK